MLPSLPSPCLSRLGLSSHFSFTFERIIGRLIKPSSPGRFPHRKIKWPGTSLLPPFCRAGWSAFFKRPLCRTCFKTLSWAAAIRLFTAAVLLFLGNGLASACAVLTRSPGWMPSSLVCSRCWPFSPVRPVPVRQYPAGMLRNFDRPSATRFAFLMAAPIMLAAGGTNRCLSLKSHILQHHSCPACRWVCSGRHHRLAFHPWLINYVSKHSLYVFATYCAVVAVLCVIAILFLG